MIAGFERPDSGRILLDGSDLVSTPPHKRPVNTVFQNYALFPFLSVADNVGFPGAPKYRAYMKEQQGKRWQTIEHETHVEYQTLIKDLVLESEFLG